MGFFGILTIFHFLQINALNDNIWDLGVMLSVVYKVKQKCSSYSKQIPINSKIRETEKFAEVSNVFKAVLVYSQ